MFSAVGRKVGTFGKTGCISFQEWKSLVCGEGGAILGSDDEFMRRCAAFINNGRDPKKQERGYPFPGSNHRMTEFQAAILLVQLERLAEQNARRMDNARYLGQLIADMPGLAPLRWDERATKHSFYLYILRYDPAAFGGVPRSRFVDALSAEGVPAFAGYTFPVYANPMFLDHNFHGKGCPINCHHYGRTVDYAAFAQTCPVTERACYEESIWLEHRLFLGDHRDMENIAEALAKVSAHVAELA